MIRAVAGATIDEVGALAEPGVRDRVGPVPQLGLHRLAGQGAERRAADEVLGALGHHRDDVGAGVDEAPADLDGLVGGDPPGHPEDDALRRPASSRSGQDSAVVVAVGADRARRRRRRRHRLGLLGQVGPLDLVGGDLLEADAQRLAGDRADLRRDHVAEALTELVEVGVDVAGPAGGQRDQAELGVDAVEELLDRRVHHRVVRAFHHFSSRDQPGNATGEQPVQRDRLAGLLDDRQHLVDRVLEVVVDDDVVGERQADRLLVLGLAQAGDDLVGRRRRARAAAAPARRGSAAGRRSAGRPGAPP